VQLIKRDVANSTLASQGLANLLNRFRSVWLKTDNTYFANDSQIMNLKNRIRNMSLFADNHSVIPIKNGEEVVMQQTNISGLDQNCLHFLKMLSFLTGIPQTKILGDSASGLNATGEGDYNNFADTIKDIQIIVNDNINLLYKYALGGINGLDSDVTFKFNDYETSLKKRELAEYRLKHLEVAEKLLNIGIKQEAVLEYLRADKDNMGFVNNMLEFEKIDDNLSLDNFEDKEDYDNVNDNNVDNKRERKQLIS
jgi:hypothetical protein